MLSVINVFIFPFPFVNGYNMKTLLPLYSINKGSLDTYFWDDCVETCLSSWRNFANGDIGFTGAAFVVCTVLAFVTEKEIFFLKLVLCRCMHKLDFCSCFYTIYHTNLFELLSPFWMLHLIGLGFCFLKNIFSFILPEATSCKYFVILILSSMKATVRNRIQIFLSSLFNIFVAYISSLFASTNESP